MGVSRIAIKVMFQRSGSSVIATIGCCRREQARSGATLSRSPLARTGTPRRDQETPPERLEHPPSATIPNPNVRTRDLTSAVGNSEKDAHGSPETVGRSASPNKRGAQHPHSRAEANERGRRGSASCGLRTGERAATGLRIASLIHRKIEMVVDEARTGTIGSDRGWQSDHRRVPERARRQRRLSKRNTVSYCERMSGSPRGG